MREALHSEGCLFCRRHDGGFKGREHPIPESLVATDTVLRRGVVCDRCNHGPLSEVDSALLNLPPIKFLRTFNGVMTKARKPVSFISPNARMAWTSSDEIRLDATGEGTVRQLGPHAIRLSLKGEPISSAQAAVLGRAIWKAGLELMYLKHGAAVGFSTRLDDVRSMVIGHRPANGYLLLVKDGTPIHRVEVEHDVRDVGGGRQMIFVTYNAYGAVLITEMLARAAPPIPPPGTDLLKF